MQKGNCNSPSATIKFHENHVSSLLTESQPFFGLGLQKFYNFCFTSLVEIAHIRNFFVQRDKKEFIKWQFYIQIT